MSDQGLEELTLLNKKLEELFERYNDLTTKNRDLTKENDTLKRYLKERDEKVKELEFKYERIKISGALMGEGEGAVVAKQKINELVREIDRCVALLNR
jgi:predicted RNase H-like nuclease (RuvC/YqgF family)